VCGTGGGEPKKALLFEILEPTLTSRGWTSKDLIPFVFDTDGMDVPGTAAQERPAKAIASPNKMAFFMAFFSPIYSNSVKLFQF
jgi:hypothetical protein